MKPITPLRCEYLLLVLLATLWGGSYLLTKIAVDEITPLCLVAARVSIAALVLFLVLMTRRIPIPRGSLIWKNLLVQSVLTSIGAWTVLSWGQQYVESGLASVLNSTAPLFVLAATPLIGTARDVGKVKILGGIVGVIGVYISMRDGFGSPGYRYLEGMAACLLGAFLYAMAAIYGKQMFSSINSCAVAFGTMLWASVILLPMAFFFENPSELSPSINAIAAVLVLAILCTALAFIIYFRLIKTIGAVGVASQAYLRPMIGVFLGATILGEHMSLTIYLGIALCIAGVVLINISFPSRTEQCIDGR